MEFARINLNLTTRGVFVSQPINRLLDIMAQLRDPEGGCPWDLEQDFKSLVPYTLEEAYEVAEAAESGDSEDLREELGDLLLQVVFHAQIGREKGLFDFDQVVEGIADKLVRRHPHVFGDVEFETPEDRQAYWEASKQEEKAERGKVAVAPSVLGDVPTDLPALMVAQKLQNRAARHGFDWPSLDPVFDKLQEEMDELREAVLLKDTNHIAEELGDVLFVLANLARHLGVDAEAALRTGNRKFRRRFHHIERRVAESGASLDQQDLTTLDSYWNEAKQIERAGR
jgi:MazG family protein